MGTDHVHEEGSDARAMEALRLDELHAAHWPKAIEGDPAATATVLDIMDRRARLLGLYLDTRAHGAECEDDDDLDALPAGVDRAEMLAMIERRLREIASRQNDQANPG